MSICRCTGRSEVTGRHHWVVFIRFTLTCFTVLERNSDEPSEQLSVTEGRKKTSSRTRIREADVVQTMLAAV